MAESLLEKIASQGILGVILAIALVVIYKINAEKDEVTKLRMDDARAYQAQLVDLIKTVTAAVTNGSAAASSTKEALLEVREALKDTAEEFRRSTPARTVDHGPERRR